MPAVSAALPESLYNPAIDEARALYPAWVFTIFLPVFIRFYLYLS
jgi:hypothetical protein